MTPALVRDPVACPQPERRRVGMGEVLPDRRAPLDQRRRSLLVDASRAVEHTTDAAARERVLRVVFAGLRPETTD